MPRTLAENSGQDATKVVSSLYAAHTAGTPNVGVNVDADGTLDAAEAEIFDAMKPKYSALQLASDAAITVLRVDTVSLAPCLLLTLHAIPHSHATLTLLAHHTQIIMAKRAGGPKVPQNNAPKSATSEYL